MSKSTPIGLRGSRQLPYWKLGARTVVGPLLFLLLGAPAPLWAAGPPSTNVSLFDACITHAGAETGAETQAAPQREPWRREAKRLKTQLQKASQSEAHRTLVVNRSLRALAAASGPLCWLASRDNQMYWAWQSSFSDALEGARVPQIGAFFDRRGARWFVSQVFSGSPAAEAGIMEGDEVRTADGGPFHPVRSFRSKERGQTIWLEVRRRATDKSISVPVKIVVASYQETLLDHMRHGHKILQIDNRPVAYLPLPAASHAAFGEALQDLLVHDQRASQALILDLRGGIDGPDRTFYEPFLGDHPLYSRPMVILQDEATSSGRERLAYLLQKTRRALVVGTESKGAAVATDLIDVAPGEYALLVAPTEAKPRAGEGRQKVIPQWRVERQGLYGAGADAPLTKALEVALQLIKADPEAAGVSRAN